MTVKTRRISKGKLQYLSINQSVLAVNRKIKKKKKRIRISAKDEEDKQTQSQQHLLSNMLPHDIMLDILSRLPVESLMRFRYVSKSWNCLIRKDYFFINIHLSRSQIQPADHEKIILTQNGHHFGLYSLDFQASDDQLERLVSHNSRFKYSHIWGTCHGLICVGGFTELYLYIWNPSTTECRKLPCFKGKHSSSCYGFGYNHNTNDYVVVKLTKFKEDNQILCHVAIYSLRNNSWRRIQNIPYRAVLRWSGQLVNGSLHWVAHSTCYVLLAFEIASGKFLELPWPDYNYDIKGANMIVSQYQGKLCVFNDKHMDNNCDFWVMNDYGVRESWTKLFNFQKSECDYMHPGIFKTLLCSTKEGSILMNSVVDGSLVLYDPKHKNHRHIVGIKTSSPIYREVKSYVPSIVALSFN